MTACELHLHSNLYDQLFNLHLKWHSKGWWSLKMPLKINIVTRYKNVSSKKFAVQVFKVLQYKQSADFRSKVCLHQIYLYEDDHIHDMVIILGVKSSMKYVMSAELT